MSELPKLRDLVCKEAPQEAIDAFNTSRDDWSCYKDHEKREMAYAAGWRSAMLAVTRAMMAEGLDSSAPDPEREAMARVCEAAKGLGCLVGCENVETVAAQFDRMLKSLADLERACALAEATAAQERARKGEG